MKRFLKFTKQVGHCLEWHGCKSKYFFFKKRCYPVRRMAWFLRYGNFPKERVLVNCGNKVCLTHLYLGKGVSRKNPITEFFENVEKTESCWIWTGWKDNNGYGRFTNPKRILAHRFSWELANKREAGEYLVCHTCDNPPCVNPSHLFIGTQKDNMHDASVKGRIVAFRGEQSPKAILTEKDVLEIRTSKKSGLDLSREYGLSRSYASQIKNKRRWNHI